MKSVSVEVNDTGFVVTPLAGVWIEMFAKIGGIHDCIVTPLAGVWIEMHK